MALDAETTKLSILATLHIMSFLGLPVAWAFDRFGRVDGPSRYAMVRSASIFAIALPALSWIALGMPAPSLGCIVGLVAFAGAALAATGLASFILANHGAPPRKRAPLDDPKAVRPGARTAHQDWARRMNRRGCGDDRPLVIMLIWIVVIAALTASGTSVGSIAAACGPQIAAFLAAVVAVVRTLVGSLVALLAPPLLAGLAALALGRLVFPRPARLEAAPPFPERRA